MLRRAWTDLGSGDGRIVIEAAIKGGYDSVGYELNPVLLVMSYWRYYYSAAAAMMMASQAELGELGGLGRGGGGRCTFKARDFWSADFSKTDVVSCFGIEPIMSRLGQKIAKEGHDGTHLVCFRFYPKPPLPAGLHLVHMNRKEELYIYQVRRKTVVE